MLILLLSTNYTCILKHFNFIVIKKTDNPKTSFYDPKNKLVYHLKISIVIYIKTTKQDNKKTLAKKSYKNPMESLWAKIIVWFLIIGMVGTVIVGLIVALVNR